MIILIPIKCNDNNYDNHCNKVPLDLPELLGPSELYQEAYGALLKAFIEQQRSGKQGIASYCKNPRGCRGIVLLADDAGSTEASCSICAFSFCASSSCDFPPHSPASCALVALWEEKGGYIETGKKADAEARKLKHQTTRPCPKCMYIYMYTIQSLFLQHCSHVKFYMLFLYKIISLDTIIIITAIIYMHTSIIYKYYK